MLSKIGKEWRKNWKQLYTNDKAPTIKVGVFFMAF